MRLFYGLFIAAILVVVFCLSYRKTKDIFSPLSFFSIFQFLRYVPHLIKSNLDSRVELNENNVFMTFIIETIFIAFVVAGYLLTKNSKKKSKIKTEYDFPFWLILIIFLSGFISRLFILQKLGGFLYVIQNMGRAYHNLTEVGNGYVNNLGFLMTVSIVMCVYKFSVSKKRIYFYISVLFVVLAMFTYLVYSSRSPALETAMFAVVSYHYFVKKIRLKSFLKPKVLLTIALALAIVVILPYLRTSSSGNSNIDYSSVVNEINSSSFFDSVANEFSVVGRDTFVYNYFNLDNYWFGANYLNLFSAIVPSSIYVNKPCLDDGNYLCNLIYGFSCTPNQGRNDLVVGYSMPFTSQSIAYANFGIIGVIVGAIAIGFLLKKTYGLINKKLSIFTIIVYVLIVYQFDLSTLGIVQTAIPLVIASLVYFVSRFFAKKVCSACVGNNHQVC